MNGEACYTQYGRECIPDRLIRRVWAAVTCDPSISVRELATHLGYASWADVAIALRVLRNAGYIAFEDRAARARTVLVPLHTSGWRIVARAD